MSRKKKIIVVAILVFFVLIGAAAFPIYNLGKEYDQQLTVLMVVETLALYFILGTFERSVFAGGKIWHIILLNVGMIVLSLLCRYLLEFGEVSNAYNFTIPNICLHMVVALAVSILAWTTSKKIPAKGSNGSK